MRRVALSRLEQVQKGVLYDKYSAKGIRWGLVRLSPPMLVLGDNVVIEVREGRKDGAYRPFERSDLAMEQVICPISPTQFLHGKMGNVEAPDAQWILEQLGRLSYQSFVAPEETEWTKYLHPQIGEVPVDAGIAREEGDELIQGYLERLSHHC